MAARRVDAPAGVTQIEWLLLTNRGVADLAKAAWRIDSYRARWEVEIFRHVLRNGCRDEALQLSTIDRIERPLPVFLVAAWRIARFMRLRRTCPDPDADKLFEPDGWKAAFILNKKAPADKSPRLNDVVRHHRDARRLPSAQGRRRCQNHLATHAASRGLRYCYLWARISITLVCNGVILIPRANGSWCCRDNYKEIGKGVILSLP